MKIKLIINKNFRIKKNIQWSNYKLKKMKIYKSLKNKKKKLKN